MLSLKTFMSSTLKADADNDSPRAEMMDKSNDLMIDVLYEAKFLIKVRKTVYCGHPLA